MTCIVGLIHDDKIWMGGDSAGANRTRLTVRKDPKVFINGDMIMGFTSSFRMGELLQYKLRLPIKHQGIDIYKYMVTDFIDAVRECLSKGGYSEKDKEVEKGGEFLVGYKGRLFKIASDYQVGESIHPYDACGSGEDLALGVMFATFGQDPESRLRTALEAAFEFNPGVRGPFTILYLEDP